MTEKRWKDYDMVVNGLPQQVRYNEQTVEDVFLPFLRRLTDLRGHMGRRIIAFLAAPPAVGKTTLAQFLEQLSRERQDVLEVKAVGMDGFHYPADYLASHSVLRDGEVVAMQSIKGAPETFDVGEMQSKIQAVRRKETMWPVYDRQIHDVVPEAEQVDAEIILLEGNWLLLKDERWTNVRVFADYSVLIRSEPELLKDRLIQRKVQGGKSRQDAEAFYENSDKHNVERVLQDSGASDEVWMMLDDGDFELAEQSETVQM